MVKVQDASGPCEEKERVFLSSFCIIFIDIDGSFMGVCYIIFSLLFFLLNIFIFQKQLQMRNKKFLV